MRQGVIILILIGFILFILQPSQLGMAEEDGNLVIATWNIANFSELKRPEKYASIEFLFTEFNLDILALQETTHSDSNMPLLELRVLMGFDDFKFCVTESTTRDPLAFIWRVETAELECFEILEFALDEQNAGNNRPSLGAIVNMADSSAGFDFTIINIHPRSSDCDSCPSDRNSASEIRGLQFDELADWVAANLEPEPDRDWILLGDYNEEFLDSNLDRIRMDFTTTQVGEPTFVGGSRIIDHIAYSFREAGAISELTMLPELEKLWLNNDYCIQTSICTEDNYKNTVSDHIPVFTKFQNVDFD